MKKKSIPKFKDETQEREFWHTHDSTEYINWNNGEKVILPKLKPSIKTISLRLPENLLNELKLLANKKGVPYQSLLKMFLSERVDAELKKLSMKNKEEMAQL
ncbi:BrnA antitoxin family protein [Desulfothermus sp.]